MTQPYSSSTAHEAHHHNRNLLQHLDQSEQRYPTPASGSSHVDNQTATSSTSITGDVDGKNDGGSCDAESDNKEADGEHEDDIAPSDSAIIFGNSQAGHTHAERTDSLTTVVQKRKRSVSLERENLAAAGPEESNRDEKSEEAEETSDPDDYAGVDLISDSEEVECTIEKLEENLIIASEEDHWDRLGPILGLSPEDWHTNSWNMCDIGDDIFHQDETPYFDEEYHRTDSIALSNISDHDHPHVIVRDQSSPSPIPDGRRVRFADPQSLAKNLSVNDGLESPRDEQSKSYHREENQTLNPRRVNSLQVLSNGFKSPHKTRHSSQIGPRKRQDGRIRISTLDQKFEGSYGSSSGYDSDHGETTEEEELWSQRTQSLLRRASQSSLRHKRSLAPKTLHRSSHRGQRAGPLMGTWIPAATKPSAVMNSACTSLIVFRLPKKAQTKQMTSHGVSTLLSPVHTGFSTSYHSFSSDTGCSMNYGELGSSDLSSLEYAARFARSDEPISIPPLLLHRNPGIPMHKYRRIEEDIPSPTAYLSQSELSFEKTFSPNEDSGENQVEPVDLDTFIEFSSDAEESFDNQEHLAATTRDSSPPTLINPQNMPTEVESLSNPPNHFPWGPATGPHNDEPDREARIPFYHEGDTLDPLDFAVDHSLWATNSASLSPDVRPSKKRRTSDGLSRAESISAARAVLAAMS